MLAQTTLPPEKFSDFASKNWLLGKKKTLLQVAQQRIEKDPNDLASIMICFDYGVDYSDLRLLRLILPQAQKAAESIKTKNFLKQRDLVFATVESIKNFLPNITEAMASAEAYKGDIPNKPLPSMPIIQALEADGLVHPATPQERALVENTNITPTISPSTTNAVSQPSLLYEPSSVPTINNHKNRQSQRTFNIPLAAGILLLLAVAGFVFYRRKP